jgi:hypothetical protein
MAVSPRFQPVVSSLGRSVLILILDFLEPYHHMLDFLGPLMRLSSFASEVTRVAREVGTEGKLGGQADVRGVAGTWKDLTDSVRLMRRKTP